MSLTKAEKKEWEEKLKEGIFFLVGVEIKAERKGTFINLLRHFNGNVRGVPSPEKGIKNKGKFAKTLVIDELLKTNFDAGANLKDAPEHILTSVVNSDGHLHNFALDFFVDVYFRVNYEEILAGVRHWVTIKSIIDSVNPDQDEIDLQPENKTK
jgi:hypothetical protein